MRESIRSVHNARLDYDELIELRDADALFNRIRMERRATRKSTSLDHERRLEMAAYIVGGVAKPDKRFGSILFERVKSKGPRAFVTSRPNPTTFDEGGRLTDEPYLELHLDATTIGDVRADMREASRWLAEEKVQEQYPYVLGCTFRELARAAGRFGLQMALPVYVRNDYHQAIRDAHTTFLMMNNRPLETQ